MNPLARQFAADTTRNRRRAVRLTPPQPAGDQAAVLAIGRPSTLPIQRPPTGADTGARLISLNALMFECLIFFLGFPFASLNAIGAYEC
jgi:hypothetical protein